ncbi:MAG: PKD domain-containing protein, partial [Lewinella sp.]
GIVVLWAPTVAFAENARLRAEGEAGNSVDGDGAGGGGAAGSILLLADNLEGALEVNLRGGSGGDTDNQSDRCFGPGGGGAGGRLLVSTLQTVDLTGIDFAGGRAGTRSGSSICGAGDGAAQPGRNGGIEEVEIERPQGGFSLSAETVCPGATIAVVDESSGADSVAWTVQPEASGLTVVNNGSGLSIGSGSTAAGSYTVEQQLYLNGQLYPGGSLPFTITAGAAADSLDVILVGDSVSVAVVNARGFDAIRYDFGDGTVVTTDKSKAGHRYATVADYTILVTLVNTACGNVDLPGGIVQPGETTRAFILEKDPTGCPGLVISPFDLSQGSYSSRRWDFPGGTPETSTAEKPTVTYTTPGVYTATLTLLGNTVGGDTTTTLQVTVFDAPVAAFDYAITDGTVTLTNKSLDATSFDWTFGDGGSSTEENPVHQYSKDSTYTITLVASGPSCTDTLRQEINLTGTTALQDLAALGISVHPNPTTGLVDVSGPATIVGVYDSRGRQVNVGAQQIDLSPLPRGMYILQLRTEVGLRRVRILKY